MATIVQKVRLFNEAYTLAHHRLSERGVQVAGPTAERLNKNIRLLMEAGRDDAEAIAKEAVDSMS